MKISTKTIDISPSNSGNFRGLLLENQENQLLDFLLLFVLNAPTMIKLKTFNKKELMLTIHFIFSGVILFGDIRGQENLLKYCCLILNLILYNEFQPYINIIIVFCAFEN